MLIFQTDGIIQQQDRQLLHGRRFQEGRHHRALHGEQVVLDEECRSRFKTSS